MCYFQSMWTQIIKKKNREKKVERGVESKGKKVQVPFRYVTRSSKQVIVSCMKNILLSIFNFYNYCFYLVFIFHAA
jgi:hypothetical protein